MGDGRISRLMTLYSALHPTDDIDGVYVSIKKKKEDNSRALKITSIYSDTMTQRVDKKGQIKTNCSD